MNQSWINQNQPWWARSWISQQLRSSPTVVQHGFQEPDTARCFDLSGPFRLGRVIFGGPTQLGALVAMTRLRMGLMTFAARLGRIIISARTLLHTAVTRDFSIVSSAARPRLGLVIFAARLGRIIISAWTLLHTTVTLGFSIVLSAVRLRLGLVIFAARLGRFISARTLLHTAVTRDFSIVSSAARLRLGLVIIVARLQPGRIISSRTLLDTAVQRNSSSGPRNLNAVISAIRLKFGRVILLLTLLHAVAQREISAARLRLGCVIFRGLAQLQPDTDMGTFINSTRITPRQSRRVRGEILVSTKLEPDPDLQANKLMTFDPGGRFHEFGGKRPTGARWAVR